MEIKLVLIYWMMIIVKSLMSLIKPQIYQPVMHFWHRPRKICVSLLSMEKSSSYLKENFMNSTAIRLILENLLTPPESSFLSQLCLESLPGFRMSVTRSIIKMVPFTKDSMSVHHRIIWTSLKTFTEMSLNWDDVTFCLQYTNEIQVKTAQRQWYQLLDAAVTII